MPGGKQTCKLLKEIRKQIAEENDIELIVEECTYKGDCLGTCPKCEAEVRYLERELEKRQRLGKAAMVAGLSVGLMAASQTAFAQQPDTLRMDTIKEEIAEDEIFGMVFETMPEFPGGMKGLSEFLQNNLVYPTEAKAEGVEGRVYVEFWIEDDGSVTEEKVIRGLGYGCDEEALRVVRLMPKWAPGTQRGHRVRVKYTLPFIFKLD